MSENSFLKEIGRSYLVSSFLPASMFIPLIILIYSGFVPTLITERLETTDSLIGQSWFLTLAVVSWVAFLLYSSFETTIYFYTGKWFPEKIRKRLSNLFEDYYLQQLSCYYKACKCRRENSNDPLYKTEELSVLSSRSKTELTSINLAFPVHMYPCAPTRLGNVFLSCADYIQDRYHIHGDMIWPRLLHVLPDTFIKNLEREA